MIDLFDAPGFYGDDNQRKVTMSDEAVVDVMPKYPASDLTSFDAGVNMDLRVRLAVEFLKGPGPWGMKSPAAAALHAATDLLELAAERGLLKAIPDHGELTAPLRRHIERNVRANVYQQTVGQRVMREESGQVMPAGASAFPAMHG